MLNEILKEKREKAKLTQNEVAEKLHVSPQSISKWERGEALPSVEFLPKLAEVYKCKVGEFFNEKTIIEIKNIPDVSTPDRFYKELKKAYDEYKQGKEFSLNEKYKGNIDFFKKVLKFLTKQSVLSISMLQRAFQIGYARAGNIVDGLEFLEMAKLNQEISYNRIIDQEKLAEYSAFLDKIS